MFVQETNFPSFQQLSQEMKQKRALHNKPHKTGRKGYRGKRKEWGEEDAKLAAEGKQNPWDQFLGRSRPYLLARVGKKKKNTSEGSGGITFSNPTVVGVTERVKTLAAQEARASESLSISKGFPFSTGAGWVCCGATYLCVGQYESIPSVCTN
jgi:hypothetical protein